MEVKTLHGKTVNILSTVDGRIGNGYVNDVPRPEDIEYLGKNESCSENVYEIWTDIEKNIMWGYGTLQYGTLYCIV